MTCQGCGRDETDFTDNPSMGPLLFCVEVFFAPLADSTTRRTERHPDWQIVSCGECAVFLKLVAKVGAGG